MDTTQSTMVIPLLLIDYSKGLTDATTGLRTVVDEMKGGHRWAQEQLSRDFEWRAKQLLGQADKLKSKKSRLENII